VKLSKNVFSGQELLCFIAEKYPRSDALIFNFVICIDVSSNTSVGRIPTRYKGRNLLTGTDRDIFGWITLNTCSITSYRTLYNSDSPIFAGRLCLALNIYPARPVLSRRLLPFNHPRWLSRKPQTGFPPKSSGRPVRIVVCPFCNKNFNVEHGGAVRDMWFTLHR